MTTDDRSRPAGDDGDAYRVGRVLSEAQRRRHQRRWQADTFPTSTGGVQRVPYPSSLESQDPAGASGGVNAVVGHQPIGQILRLSIHAHLGNGGEPVLFDSVTHRNGFDGANFPNGSVLLPSDAIYGIEGEIEWADCYTGGGQVNLYIDGVKYDDAFRGYGDAWTRFSFVDEFDAQAGQRLSIEVVHDDTSQDHDLHGHVTVATKEPLRTIVEQPAGDALMFSLKAATQADFAVAVNLNSGATAELWQATGTGTGADAIGDCAFDSDGTLWALVSLSTGAFGLRQYDPSDGSVLTEHDISAGQPSNLGPCCAVDPNSNCVYMGQFSVTGAESIWCLDRLTGNWAETTETPADIGNVTSWGKVYGGNLVYLNYQDDDGNSRLFTIDPQSGAVADEIGIDLPHIDSVGLDVGRTGQWWTFFEGTVGTDTWGFVPFDIDTGAVGPVVTLDDDDWTNIRGFAIYDSATLT